MDTQQTIYLATESIDLVRQMVKLYSEQEKELATAKSEIARLKVENDSASDTIADLIVEPIELRESKDRLKKEYDVLNDTNVDLYLQNLKLI